MPGQRQVGLDGDPPGAVDLGARTPPPAGRPADAAATPAAHTTVRAPTRWRSPPGDSSSSPSVVDPDHHRVEHRRHAEVVELPLGALRQVGRERGEHARPGLHQQDPPRLGVHRAEVARQRVAGELGDLARHLDAGRPGADDREGQPLRALHRVGLELGRLERREDLPAHLDRVLQRLDLLRVLLPLVVAEVGVLRARRDEQRVVGDLDGRHVRQRRLHLDHAVGEVDLADLPQQHPHVRRALEDRAQRRRDLARRQRAGRHLVDERLEEVEVPPVDQRHLEVVVLAQLVDRLQPAEAAADHDHARAGVRLGRLRPAVEVHRRAPDQRQRDAAEQRARRRARAAVRGSPSSSAQRALHDLLRLLDDPVEVLLAAERLGVDLVDVLGAGRARREPAARADDLEAADRGAVARAPR